MFIVFPHGDKTVRGLNPNLVNYYETTPQGGATLYMMGSWTLSLTPPQWDLVRPLLSPEPHGAGTPAGGQAAG